MHVDVLTDLFLQITFLYVIELSLLTYSNESLNDNLYSIEMDLCYVNSFSYVSIMTPCRI